MEYSLLSVILRGWVEKILHGSTVISVGAHPLVCFEPQGVKPN